MHEYYLFAVNEFFERLPEFSDLWCVDFNLRCHLSGLRMEIYVDVDYFDYLTENIIKVIYSFAQDHDLTIRKPKVYAELDFPCLIENQDRILTLMKTLKGLGVDLLVENEDGKTFISCLNDYGFFPNSFITELLVLFWDHPKIIKWRKQIMDSIIQEMLASRLINQMSENKKNALFQIFTRSEMFEERLFLGSVVPE